MERQKHRFIPKGLNELQFATAFNRKELQMLYRGFKEACPNGIVTAEKFNEILSYFFPYGETKRYATFVFDTFDEDGNGEISFEVSFIQ